MALSACGALQPKSDQPANTSDNGTGDSAPQNPGGHTVPASDVEMDPPPKLTAPLLSSDVLVYSQDTLSPEVIDSIRAIKTAKGKPAVSSVEPFSMGSFYVDEQEVTYAAVNPATFRRLTPQGTAQTAGRLGPGGRRGDRGQPGDRQEARHQGRLPQARQRVRRHRRVHIGAYAQILDPTYAHQIDAVVNSKWVKPLGMQPRTTR